MPNLNNPAARLHVVLSRFASSQSAGQAVQVVWSSALGVPRHEVPSELCRLAGLVPQIVEIVRLGGDEHQIDNVNHWAPRWAAVLTESSTSGANADGYIKDDLLRNLGVTASYLNYVAGEGTVPDEEQIGRLRGQVVSLLDEAREAEKLPLELRTVLVRRLHDIVYALDHVELLGPDGVQAAVERLMCAIAMRDTEGADGGEGDDGILSRIRETASSVYAAFLFGPAAYQAVEGWSAIGQRMLGM